MARRRNGGLFEDLMDAAALLPWWAGVAIALVAYFALHTYATAQVAPAAPGQFGEVIAKGFASMLQYVIPIACLFGAMVSAVKRAKNKELVSKVAAGESHAVLADMSWQEFEALVGEGFRLKGYAVEQRGGASADGGIDLILRKGAEKALVQCKQWRATKVPVDTVRELLGVMTAEGATHGFVVTSGQFTRDAREFVSGRNIELMDGPRLFEMFDHIRAEVGKQDPWLPDSAPTVPDCPSCGKSMVRRTAKKGGNAGKPFWGCVSYPACRGTRPI